MNHECMIGLYYHNGYAELVSLPVLKEHIEDNREFNKSAKKFGVPVSRKEWTLKEYADKRKSTNLTRFDYCPECGKKIDWKAIRKEDAT